MHEESIDLTEVTLPAYFINREGEKVRIEGINQQGPGWVGFVMYPDDTDLRGWWEQDGSIGGCGGRITYLGANDLMYQINKPLKVTGLEIRERFFAEV